MESIFYAVLWLLLLGGLAGTLLAFFYEKLSPREEMPKEETKHEEKEPMIAHVLCAGGDRAKEKYIYEGIRDCRIAARLAGGNKLCHNGCTGLGNCERACAFDAIHIINGVAVVDEKACRSCGECVKACPKSLIQMLPASAKFAVHCQSCDKGAAVMRACEAGCIGCKKCEKVCETGAITVENLCAKIDLAKCISCGNCVEVCPRGIIREIFPK